MKPGDLVSKSDDFLAVGLTADVHDNTALFSVDYFTYWLQSNDVALVIARRRGGFQRDVLLLIGDHVGWARSGHMKRHSC